MLLYQNLSSTRAETWNPLLLSFGLIYSSLAHCIIRPGSIPPPEVPDCLHLPLVPSTDLTSVMMSPLLRWPQTPKGGACPGTVCPWALVWTRFGTSLVFWRLRLEWSQLLVPAWRGSQILSPLVRTVASWSSINRQNCGTRKVPFP